MATAVCAPLTKTIHFSHAAVALARREGFAGKAMCSDTWPNKESFWKKLFVDLEGRLGLFHYERRILSAIRKKHVDFHDMTTDLLSALYEHDSTDYEKLLIALKSGSLSSSKSKKKCYSTEEIAALQSTKCFRDRYGRFLHKKLRGPNTMAQRLDDWFCRYKVTSTDPTRPARGRLDPCHNMPLFTQDTREAVANCKENAIHLADPMSIDEMHHAIPANENSSHQLTEHLSNRGESKLESFHDRLANFANSGMRDSLADNLHLAGAARHNLAIRHKRRVLTLLTTDGNASKTGREIPAVSVGPRASLLQPFRAWFCQQNSGRCEL